MRGTKSFLILALITIVVGAAAFLTPKEESKINRAGEVVFPDLAQKLESVQKVVATSAGQVVNLKRAGDGWVVEERNDYPANIQDVTALLIGTGDFVRVEPKTAKPENYEALEVDDPMDEESVAIQYELLDGSGQALASYVMGKRRIGKTNPHAEEYFIRTKEDPQVWLVAGKVPRHRIAPSWLSNELLKFDARRIKRVVIKHSDGDVLEVVKNAPEESTYMLMDIPEGREVEVPFRVHGVASVLSDLNLNDVKKIEDFDFSDLELTATLETFDGMRLVVESKKDEDYTYVRLNATFEPELVWPQPATSPETSDAKQPADQKNGAPPPLELLDEEAIKAEIAKLNSGSASWAYQVSTFSMDNLRKRMKDLTKEIKTDESKASDG